MATTTTNFGWDIPQSTDLVKDGATAIAALGQDIDTALVDLKGGTTGQILAKASNTDLDYSWITNDVGDITAVTAGTGITGGGTSGAVTVSFDQANFGGGQLAGGKNRVLNSNFSVWQRGTSIACTTSSYTADRWQGFRSVAGATVSRQVTGDTTNLPNIQYCARVQRDSGNTSTTDILLSQSFESVNSIPLAGKAVVLSFYARKGATYSQASSNITFELSSGTGTDQNRLGGYTGQNAVISSTATLTTTWQRFTYTGTVPTTATEIAFFAYYIPVGTAGATDYFEITGVQIEAGTSTASPYAPNTSTYQAELAACQRYYYRTSTVGLYGFYGVGLGTGTTSGTTQVKLAQTMRVVPTSLDSTTIGNYRFWNSTTSTATTAVGIDTATSTTDLCGLNFNVAAGLVGGSFYMLTSNNNASTYLGFSAEL
jgi:hypothetical protein